MSRILSPLALTKESDEKELKDGPSSHDVRERPVSCPVSDVEQTDGQPVGRHPDEDG